MNRTSNIVIVPDGLKADSTGRSLAEPSFVFRQVLDYVAEKAAPNSLIYIAPANTFGGPEPEHWVGRSYLKNKRSDLRVCTPDKIYLFYLDTFLNAYHLRDEFKEIIETPITLVSTRVHLKRAEYCFRQLGYSISESIGVQISMKNKELTVKRLFYYQFPFLHFMYECFAFVRELALTTMRLQKRKPCKTKKVTEGSRLWV